MLDTNDTGISYQSVLNFWFSEPANELWFTSTLEFDQEILNKYHSLWKNAKNQKLIEWKKTAEGCLALAIVFDQFPLNMFRGTIKSFSTEAHAIEISHHAINNNLDEQLASQQRLFLYMPLMHSENIEDQNLSVELFTNSGLDKNLRFAKHHRDIIKKYGRFPHRNRILERTSTEDELEYLNSPQAFTG